MDQALPVGQYGQMSLIRTPDALTGGTEIRFVNWTVAGQRGRLVSLDHSVKHIWTTNSQCKELGLVDATVRIRNTGTRCLQVKKEFRPTIDWEVVHIKHMCSLALDNLQCPCELCGMTTSHGLTTETCAVCMIPTHATCLDNAIAEFDQSSAPFGDVRPADVTTTLTTLGIHAQDLSHVQVGVVHAWGLTQQVSAQRQCS